MPLLPIAVSLRCLKQPLKSAVGTAATLGAVGLQFDARTELKPGEMSGTGRRHFLHLLKEHGLKVSSLDFPLRRSLWEPEQLDARLDALKKTLQFAFELGTATVTASLGRLPPEEDATAMRLVGDVLNELARHANRVGATLALGLGRDPPSRVAALLRGVSEGPLGINFDPATCLAAEQEPIEVLTAAGSLLSHVVARDAVRDLQGLGNEVPLGRGDVPWEEVLALLFEVGYRGWITVDRTQGEDTAGDAARAVQYLKSILLG